MLFTEIVLVGKSEVILGESPGWHPSRRLNLAWGSQRGEQALSLEPRPATL